MRWPSARGGGDPGLHMGGARSGVAAAFSLDGDVLAGRRCVRKLQAVSRPSKACKKENFP